MSDTQLATREERTPVEAGNYGLELRSLDEMWRVAQMIHNSGMAPSFKTPTAIMVAIQMGAELGLAPMKALNSICVINGRPTLYGTGALGVVQNHPDFEDIEETIKDGVATCIIRRRGRTPTVRTFSMEDARRAKLANKSGPWTDYPPRMLQMRARSWAMRDAFPDALSGIGVSDEMQDVEPKPARVVKEVDITFPDDKPEPPQLPEKAEEGTLL